MKSQIANIGDIVTHYQLYYLELGFMRGTLFSSFNIISKITLPPLQ